MREVVIMIQGATEGMKVEPLDGWIARLLAEYAQKPLASPLDPRLSLRDDLAVESLSLVSLVVRLGDKLGVDAADDSLDLAGLATVGDLLALARRLEGQSRGTAEAGTAHTER
jgi:acyl carrier protein